MYAFRLEKLYTFSKDFLSFESFSAFFYPEIMPFISKYMKNKYFYLE